MKTKSWLSMLIVAGWLVGTAAQAQQPIYQPTFPAPAPLNVNATPDQPAPVTTPERGVLSDWIVYRCDRCEGRFERATPLYTELYFETGASVPVGGMTLSRELKTGWSIAGGARALIFNEAQTRAWVFDAHVLNTNESGGKQDTAFPVTIIHNGTKIAFGSGGTPGATIHDYNRTFFGLGLGHDWFLRPSNFDSCNWRVGLDGGGRYGSGRINFNEVGHITDVIGSMYFGVHSDLEFPIRDAIWHVGLRMEWAYTWSDILQRTSDVQDLNFYVTFGARY
jgi:hypothetical protein